MARVRFNVSKASKSLTRQIESAIKDPRLETSIGEFLVERVKLEARRGRPINDDGKFPELAESTKRIRKQLRRFNRTASAYSEKKSNLTFTGQLLDAVDFKRTSKNIFSLFVKNSRRSRLRSKDGLLPASGTNKQVDEELRAGVGSRKRKFVMFSTLGLKRSERILRRVRQLFVRSLRRQLRRS